MKIGIVSVGLGNVGSIRNMLKKIGYKSTLLVEPDSMVKYDIYILPGVGAFDEGIKRLKQSGWFDFLKSVAYDKSIKIIGICLGMQLLCSGSEEGTLSGLNLIPGRFKKFKSDILKIPHMGWNTVDFTIPDFTVLENSRYYFVHSYKYMHENENYVLGRTKYGEQFVSAIYNDNIWGFQFHPEKSHKFGMQLLRDLIGDNNVLT